MIRSDPVEEPLLSDDAARALVAATSWYHRWELRPGLVTPGSSDMAAAAACDSLGVPRDLSGRRALDIGAWDGPITFELERRGATAAALDVQSPDRVGFSAARRVLGSRAVHYEGSVYELGRSELSDLDLIVFRGVYYHLKYPILAFERIAAALRIGGTVHFEGEGLINYAESVTGEPIDAQLASRLGALDAPICMIYPNRYREASNWHVPNAACLRGWMEVCGLEVRAMHRYTENGAQRLFGFAEKVSETVELEHPMY